MAMLAGAIKESADKAKPVSGKNRKHFLKTELCRFYPRCNKGDACPFAHSGEELKDQPDLTKTALCTSWRRGRCPHESANCKFAHGAWDLRDPTLDAAALRNRRQCQTRSTPEVLPPTPMGDKERWAETTTTGTRTPSGTATASDTQSDSGSDRPGETPIRQAPSFNDFSDVFEKMSRQVSFEGVPKRGMSRQVSIDGVNKQGMSRQVSGNNKQGMSRQVSFDGVNRQGMNRQVSFDGVNRQGMSRQVSFDGMTKQSMSRQISIDAVNNWQGMSMSRQVSCDGVNGQVPSYDGGMSRQVTPMAMVAVPIVCPSPEGAQNTMVSQGMSPLSQMSPQPTQTLQMPVLVKMGSVQMPVLASMMNMSPQAVTATQSQIEKALTAAVPEYYED